MSFSFKQVREKLNNEVPKKEKNKGKKGRNVEQAQTKMMVKMPYGKEVSDALQRTFRRHGVATSMKPHKTLGQLLVHHSDKRSAEDLA